MICRNSQPIGVLTNVYADDSLIYASGDNILEVKQKLQNCIKNISSWYKMNLFENQYWQN